MPDMGVRVCVSSSAARPRRQPPQAPGVLVPAAAIACAMATDVVFVVARRARSQRARHARRKLGDDRQVLDGLAPASTWC